MGIGNEKREGEGGMEGGMGKGGGRERGDGEKQDLILF